LGQPGLVGGPGGGAGGVDRLGLDAGGAAFACAVAHPAAPGAAADGGQVVAVGEGDQGGEPELAVVHAGGGDHLAGAVDALGGDPRHVGALAGVDLGGAAGADEVAVVVLGGAGPGAQDGVERAGGAVGHREAQGADGVVHGILSSFSAPSSLFPGGSTTRSVSC